MSLENEVKEEVKPLQFTVAQMIPWAVVLVLLVAFVTYVLVNKGGSNTTPNPTPSPAPVDYNVAKLEEILTFDEAQYLSSVCKKVAMFVEKDSSILTSRKDILQLDEATGMVVTLDHAPFNGLGDVVATYFDEEAEFPQTHGTLTPEDRQMAVRAWQKLSDDLAKVKD